MPLCAFNFDTDCDLECAGVFLFSVSLLLVDVELKRRAIGPSVTSVPNLELLCALSFGLPVCLPHPEIGTLEDTLLEPLLRGGVFGLVEPLLRVGVFGLIEPLLRVGVVGLVEPLLRGGVVGLVEPLLRVGVVGLVELLLRGGVVGLVEPLLRGGVVGLVEPLLRVGMVGLVESE